MEYEKLETIQKFFNQIDDYKEIIPTDKITEEYALDLLEEVERLRAALKYIGQYNENKCNHHSPSTPYFHVKEVAREHLDCEVDYRDRV